MSSWLSAVEGFAAAAIPAVGLIYTYTTNKRSQYERVLALTGQVSTPPISDDRHVIGTALEPLSKHEPGKPVKLGEAEIKALYNVLWYFQRADAVYISLRPLLWPARITRVQALLLDTLASAVNIWNDYVTMELADSEGRPIDATDVTPFLRRLASEHARLQAHRSPVISP